MCARYFSVRPTDVHQSRSFSQWIRQAHRSLAILFTLTVLANFATMIGGQPRAWITYSPLPPLLLLLFSGLYMFVLPYLARRQGAKQGA
jgi:hypothetical protein